MAGRGLVALKKEGRKFIKIRHWHSERNIYIEWKRRWWNIDRVNTTEYYWDWIETARILLRTRTKRKENRTRGWDDIKNDKKKYEEL